MPSPATFTLLGCVDCRFFHPKALNPLPAGEAPAAYVGLCAPDDQSPRWTVWTGLERAVARAGTCPDREARAIEDARCPLFDASAESSALPYPKSCVHYDTPVCRISTRNA